MRDIQNDPSSFAIGIDRVGVKGLTLPIVVSDRSCGLQHTVATVDLGVDLPSEFKGTHMSRFIEALENWTEELSFRSIKNLLISVKDRLTARKAYATFRFTYFLRKKSPMTGADSIMGYECCLTGELGSDSQKPVVLGEVLVPIMTVCPCSLAISEQGAHSQRAVVKITAKMDGFIWLEELIELAEKASSSPLYPLLKREDEKFVTEQAFAHPMFVEDVVRKVSLGLFENKLISWFKVEVESFESIHSHNAYASIEKKRG